MSRLDEPKDDSKKLSNDNNEDYVNKIYKLDKIIGIKNKLNRKKIG